MNIYLGIDKADSHLDEFTYNNETGEVEYHPEITLDKYEQIEEGMTEETVTSILGEGEKTETNGSNGFLITWGELNIWEPPYYVIQITFDSSKKVVSKQQMGLE